MTKTTTLPVVLFDAYNWTTDAGELDELRTTRAPRRYARKSAANNQSEGDGTVTADDLMRLRAWLRVQKGVR